MFEKISSKVLWLVELSLYDEMPKKAYTCNKIQVPIYIIHKIVICPMNIYAHKSWQNLCPLLVTSFLCMFCCQNSSSLRHLTPNRPSQTALWSVCSELVLHKFSVNSYGYWFPDWWWPIWSFQVFRFLYELFNIYFVMTFLLSLHVTLTTFGSTHELGPKLRQRPTSNWPSESVSVGTWLMLAQKLRKVNDCITLHYN